MVKRFELQNNTLVPSESPESAVLLYVNPEPAEKSFLLKSFAIDEHTFQSALDPDEVSRIEINNDTVSLIWKRPLNYSGQDNFYFNVASVGVFLFRDRVVFVLTEDISISSPGSRKIHQLTSLLDVVIGFLYDTIQHYLEHLKVIKMISRDLQQKINMSMENKHLIQMFNLSESLIYYVNAINSNNAVLSRLRLHAEKANFSPQMLGLIDDVIIENTQCLKQAEIYSTVFSGLMDARGSLVNNNMNQLLRKLTIINIVFLPLNLIAGIGGMSEFSMMTGGIHWGISYTFFSLAMVLIGWLTAYILGKLDVTGEKAPRHKPRKRKRF